MKKFLVVFFGLMMAQSLLAAESANIVTVDVLRAVMSTEEGKIKVEKLKGEFEKEKAGLEALNMKGKNLQERIQKDGAVMSAEERHKMEKELMEIAQELKFKEQQLKQSGQADQRQVVESMLPKFQQAMKDIIAEQKIDMVLRREAVLDMNPKLDITDLVVEKMNNIKN
ncbi:MAG: OmpH family outer membrane protein [Ketobacter sp.]|uniref:OmpH family outer membrane protein n=1 Tax=unclassified Ketobacter TaxID=2639109 RepID=UPI0025C6C7A6|nr:MULTISPECIES: OmpH family outer membrane protein [unclassified Ketobacter]MCK5792636.1 OmpH family outer membrane protein [Ketobacter sp.]MEC8814106.1 OmpH family outer membrane protein [Pseudomonadota bacterium]